MTVWCYILRLDPRAPVEHLAIQRVWAAARLLVARVSPMYLVEEFIFYFLV